MMIGMTLDGVYSCIICARGRVRGHHGPIPAPGPWPWIAVLRMEPEPAFRRQINLSVANA